MHKALYRSYRPQNFEDVVGQEHIIRTLKNQIENNNVGHAYLFSGDVVDHVLPGDGAAVLRVEFVAVEIGRAHV